MKLNLFRSNKKSIRKRIIRIFILMIVILVIVFTTSYYFESKITTGYKHFVDINSKLTKLSMNINLSSIAFTNYSQTEESRYLNEYYQINNKIRTIISSVEDEVNKGENSSIFLRTLENMFEYNQQLVKDFLNKDVQGKEKYQLISDIKTLYFYMNNQSQQLITTYLDYSNVQYLDLMKKYNIMRRNIYILVIVVGLIFLVLLTFLSKDVLQEIYNLTRFAGKLSNGNWGISDLQGSQYQELNILATTFNKMKNNIKDYIEQMKQKSELEKKLNQEKMLNIEKEKLLRESQLMNLQMQMDPHFLFNTLNTIARTAMFESAHETVGLIESVAKILRYNLENTGNSVKLEKEIDVLKAYLHIHKIRFQDQMEFKVKINANIEDVKLPPMIIQPVVENAIIHGLANKQENGKIQILVDQDKDKNILIKVEDNGQGIKPAKIKEILYDKKTRKETNENKKNGTSLGLKNVQKRLELFYERKNLLDIKSKCGEKTVIIITIPWRENND